MEKLNVHQKAPKQAKAKKKPLKVVYISNPMLVKASASQFRSVVQELTGQDSDISDHLNKLSPSAYHEFADFSLPADESEGSVQQVGKPSYEYSIDPSSDKSSGIASTSESYNDEILSSQMLEYVTGYFPSPPTYCEPHFGGF